MVLFTLSSTRHTSLDFCFSVFFFSRHPCLFQIETLLVIFLFLIRFGSTRISLNRHSASSTFYPTLVILDAFDHGHSTSILSITKYLELLGLFSCLSGWRRIFFPCYCIFVKSTFFKACSFFLFYFFSLLCCICIAIYVPTYLFFTVISIQLCIYIFVTHLFNLPRDLRISHLLDGVCIT